MFGIGIPELILIVVIGLVFFGPGRLPELGRALGNSINEFKKALGGPRIDDAESKKKSH